MAESSACSSRATDSGWVSEGSVELTAIARFSPVAMARLRDWSFVSSTVRLSAGERRIVPADAGGLVLEDMLMVMVL